MAIVTLTFQDNPMPGQADFTTTVVSDPPLPMPPSPDNAKRLTPAQMAAVAAVAHITQMTYETVWVYLNQQ